jgi:hypothetical protein
MTVTSLAGRLSGTEAVGSGDTLHRPGQLPERDIVVRIRRRGPVKISEARRR